jgi:hypothetical protein
MIYTTRELEDMWLILQRDIEGYTEDMKKAAVREAFFVMPGIPPSPAYYRLAKELNMMEEIEMELKLQKLKERGME